MTACRTPDLSSPIYANISDHNLRIGLDFFDYITPHAKDRGADISILAPHMTHHPRNDLRYKNNGPSHERVEDSAQQA